MNYTQIKIYTGCAFPLGAFLFVAGFTLYGMLTGSTGYGFLLTIGAPLGLGLAALITAWAMVTPINRYLFKKELMSGRGSERLAHWSTDNPPQEAYIGVDGLVLNGKLHYWDALLHDLVGVELVERDGRPFLHLDLTADYGRGPRPYELEIAVPEGRSLEAKNVVKTIREKRTLLDEKGNRLT